MPYPITVSADTHEALKAAVAKRGNPGETPEDLAEAILDDVLIVRGAVLPNTENWSERKLRAGGAKAMISAIDGERFPDGDRLPPDGGSRADRPLTEPGAPDEPDVPEGYIRDEG